MKNKQLLLEDFHSIIPEFLLDDAVQKCVDKWIPSARKTIYISQADALIEELRALMKRYIFMNPTWKSSVQKAQVATIATQVLDDSRKKVVTVLCMPGRERDEIQGFLRDLILQQVDTFLRGSSTVTRP